MSSKKIIIRNPVEDIDGTKHLEFQTWCVTIQAWYYEVQPEPQGAVFFVRASDPRLAAKYAASFWRKIHRPPEKQYDKFPRLGEVGSIERIDESDYREAWRSCQKYQPKLYGPRENPLGFTFDIPDTKPLIKLN